MKLYSLLNQYWTTYKGELRQIRILMDRYVNYTKPHLFTVFGYKVFHDFLSAVLMMCILTALIWVRYQV